MIPALLAAGGIVAVVWLRKLPTGGRWGWIATGGLVLLVLAAGQPGWVRLVPGDVWVMVDLSPSTRTANFRDPDWLNQRLDSLLQGVPYRLILFGQTNLPVGSLPRLLEDMPGDSTRFAPPPADAVVLFSDGQFDLPAYSPPVFAIIDPALEQVDDAAVKTLRLENGQAIAELRPGRTPRRLQWTGVQGPDMDELSPRQGLLVRHIDPQAPVVRARLLPPDAWPENDVLEILNLQPQARIPWWIGASRPAGWRGLQPGELPTDTAAWVSVPLIVLHDVAAADLTPLQQVRLMQYVRDLGGSVLITGARRAFGAGGYIGSVLETLSPLSSHPPIPLRHWVVLVDASGSMAAPTDQGTRWTHALQALQQVIVRLPPADAVSIAGFARRIDWWILGQTVEQLDPTHIPPAAVRPGGPTNLEPALLTVLEKATADLPLEIILLTDADIELPRFELLRQQLLRTGARLHLLALDEGQGLGLLAELVHASGGQWLSQTDPLLWAQSADDLLRSATPSMTEHRPVRIELMDVLKNVSSDEVQPWIRTWLKPDAQLLARSEDETSAVLGAIWNLGLGRVMALSFEPSLQLIEIVGDLLLAVPIDPRFDVTFDLGRELQVEVQAQQQGSPMNRLELTLELGMTGGGASVHRLEQVAPGRYQVVLPAPADSTQARMLHEGAEIARAPLAGRYPPQFERIGNNRDTLGMLVDRWGGRIVEPDEQVLDLRTRRATVSLQPWLITAGALLMAGWLVGIRREARLNSPRSTSFSARF